MGNTAPKKMKDETCDTSNCDTTGECPCCATIKSCCLICKVARFIFRGLVLLALAKFVFCGSGSYHMRGGVDKGSMMMSGSLRDYKSEKGFFKKRFDRDDTIVGTGLIATESTQ